FLGFEVANQSCGLHVYRVTDWELYVYFGDRRDIEDALRSLNNSHLVMTSGNCFLSGIDKGRPGRRGCISLLVLVLPATELGNSLLSIRAQSSSIHREFGNNGLLRGELGEVVLVILGDLDLGFGESGFVPFVSAAVPARCEGCGKFAQISTEVSLVDLHPTETCSDKMASSVASWQTGSRGQRFTSA
ncbi:hypothetical protein KSS87_001617, partial [Heliosperma pusillum]